MQTTTPFQATFQPLSILVVDDDPLLLRALARMLREHELHLACDAESALVALRSVPIDVVLSDHQMPGSDGITLLETVRQESPMTRRVLMSGSAPRDLKELRLTQVVQHFIHKPFKVDVAAQLTQLTYDPIQLPAVASHDVN